MSRIRLRSCLLPVSVAVALVSTASMATAAQSRHKVHRQNAEVADASGYRPLTIGGHRGRGRGVYRVGNDIIAVGGFSANGYGYPVATAEERREYRNAQIREAATGDYDYEFGGVGGFGLNDGLGSGYSNPYYGNTYSSYVGYNGTPTALAFGPGFANRHLAEHDPFDDDDEPGPTPADIGYQTDSE